MYLGESKNVTILRNELVCRTYIMWSKQIRQWNVPTLVGSIMVVCALTGCAFLYFVSDLKVAQMNVQFNSEIYSLQVPTEW